MKRHVSDIEYNKRKNLPWWKRYSERWSIDSLSDEDFIKAEEFIKNNVKRAKEIENYAYMPTESLEYVMAKMTPGEKKVYSLFLHKHILIRLLKGEGREQEAKEL